MAWFFWHVPAIDRRLRHQFVLLEPRRCFRQLVCPVAAHLEASRNSMHADAKNRIPEGQYNSVGIGGGKTGSLHDPCARSCMGGSSNVTCRKRPAPRKPDRPREVSGPAADVEGR